MVALSRRRAFQLIIPSPTHKTKQNNNPIRVAAAAAEANNDLHQQQNPSSVIQSRRAGCIPHSSSMCTQPVPVCDSSPPFPNWSLPKQIVHPSIYLCRRLTILLLPLHFLLLRLLGAQIFSFFVASSALWPFVPMQLPLCTLLIGHLCTFNTFRIYYFRIRDPTMSHYPHRASAASQTELIYVCVWWFSAIHPPASQCTRPVSSQLRPFGWRQSQWLSAAGCTAE